MYFQGDTEPPGKAGSQPLEQIYGWLLEVTASTDPDHYQIENSLLASTAAFRTFPRRESGSGGLAVGHKKPAPAGATIGGGF